MATASGFRAAAVWGSALIAGACGPRGVDPAEIRERIRLRSNAVDAPRLREADRDTANWLTHGRTYAEDRYSPLRQIDLATIDSLGLLWQLELSTRYSAEATPLALDGVLFTTDAWSVVLALDATDGRVVWRWDPEVPREHLQHLCCGPVNRGAALHEGKVFVGTADGRLVALDAATGEPVWSTRTTPVDQPYSITGAPRVFGGLVVIGNSGADMGVRGYVSAYAADTGELVWRTYTVPGNPAHGFESEAMRRAAATWSGKWWIAGGGGTVWDAIVFDPELDIVYVGTGNGSPHNRYVRSPGGGDNLYLASILALRRIDGEMLWHFQTTPAETWDYTATQPMILADLEWQGRRRRVLMQAPKNGFFYVLDRETGEFLSGTPFAQVTWAIGLDPVTGRPTEAPGAFPPDGVWRVRPNATGAHNWHPMSLSRQTGYVYLPVREEDAIIVPDPTWEYMPGQPNTGTGPNAIVSRPRSMMLSPRRGSLVAWDPVAGEVAWRVALPSSSNGGTLSTAGGLVFQGTGDGRLVAYDARDGAEAWSSPVGAPVGAAPITYAFDGRQYVTVVVGGSSGLNTPAGRDPVSGPSRILTFALGGSERPPEPDDPTPPPPPDVRRLTRGLDPDQVRAGSPLYHRYCARCHGVAAESGGAVSDLRYAMPRVHDRFDEIVRGGTLSALGMPSFADVLTEEDVLLIRAFVLGRARRLSRPPNLTVPDLEDQEIRRPPR